MHATWKELVWEKALEIAQEKRSSRFHLNDLYDSTDYFSEHFPSNRHPREKIRQTLQQLRDAGFLNFVQGEGEYELNPECIDFEIVPAAEMDAQVIPPRMQFVTREIRVRNRLIVCDLKMQYKNLCQVCKVPVFIAENRQYSEVHHLQPLGKPHLGPDIRSNIVVLCPNHHVMFDAGAAAIHPKTHLIEHLNSEVFPMPKRLFLMNGHMIGRRYLEYHYLERYRGQLK